MHIPETTYKNGVWTGPKVSLPAGYYELGKRFIDQLKNNCELIAQIDGKTERSETFGVIYDKSVRCALWLRKYGVGRNDVIGYCSANHMNSCIPFLASFYVGSVFNPWWNGRLDDEMTKFFLEYTRPKVLFIDEESAQIILKVIKDVNCDVKIIVFGEISELESFTDILNQANVHEIHAFECTKINSADEPALILYTSGTTNMPKGALHSYESIISMIGPISNERTVTLWFTNLSWISGVKRTVQWILTQSTAIIHDNPSEKVGCELIQKFKVTRLTMGTSLANRLCKLKDVEKYDFSSIKFVFFSGAVTRKEIVESIVNLFKNAEVTTAFGSTECMGTIGTINPKKPTSCGRVFPNHEIKVIDLETNEILGPNSSGEIYCRGTSKMKLYWNSPEATSDAIAVDGWYRTGDIGYYDDDGDFFIIDRMKEMIKYRYNSIAPAVIERVIYDIDGVNEVGVVAKPNFADAEVPTAFITKIQGAQITAEQVCKKVEDELHDSMKLRGGVYFLDKMPHTSSGKIAKRELRALAKSQAKW